MSGSLTAARMSYAAALVGAFTYGLYVAIALYTFAQVCKSACHRGLGKRILAGWIVTTFVVQTVYFVSASKWSEIEFVESASDPGVFAGELSSRLALLKDTCYTVIIWLADAFILYRATVIYSGQLYVVSLPALLYLGSLAAGIGLLVETAKPGAAFGQASVIDFGTPFWSLSVSMNVLSTVLIVGRLLHRRDVFYGTGERRRRYRLYEVETAVFLESAALYAICAIVYIPMFSKDIPLQFPFSALLGSAASIAPHFIIVRMASGRSTQMEVSLISLQERGRSETANGRESAVPGAVRLIRSFPK
ncbi:hypothetical protein C8Q79DRAFT_903319 [Trametes meyenii]|nr:hypothetical protein C8Q79DRAFT_903319 [Trametes meyenii]